MSRVWFDFAWKVLVRHLQLTTTSLTRFTDDDALLSRSQPYITTVRLCLEYGKPNQPPSVDEAALGFGHDESALQPNASVAMLADALKRCPSLKSLELKARALDMERRQYMVAKPLTDLLSVCRLTTSEIDTASCPFKKQADEPGLHLCRSINGLLPSLQRLRYRMERVCEVLLKEPAGEKPLVLRELIVNLSLSELSDTSTSYRHSRSCQSPSGSGTLQLKEAMERQATTLSARLCNPRMVRVISHTLPSLDIIAYDAITGKRIHLKNNVEWDAEGEVVAEARSDGGEDEDTDLFEGESADTPFIDL